MQNTGAAWTIGERGYGQPLGLNSQVQQLRLHRHRHWRLPVNSGEPRDLSRHKRDLRLWQGRTRAVHSLEWCQRRCGQNRSCLQETSTTPPAPTRLCHNERSWRCLRVGDAACLVPDKDMRRACGMCTCQCDTCAVCGLLCPCIV